MTSTVKAPEGWIETTLGELIKSGEFNIKNNLRQPISSNVRATIHGIYPYYGAASAIDYLDHYSVEGYHLLMAEDGTVTIDGKHPMLQLVDGLFNVSNHAHILQGKDKKKTKLLFYILSNVDISAFITGAVQPKLSKENLFKISFLYPSEEELESIVDILSSFDDKIELLKTENQTLEEMGQTLFKEWFGKYKVGDELPDGWKVGKLGDIVNHIKINVIPSKEPEKIFSHYSLPAFDEGEKPSKEKGELIMSNKYKVIDNCILISKLNPFFSRIRTIFRPEDNAVCSTEFQVLEPKKDMYFSYCHCLLKSQKFTDDISKKVQGTSSSHQRVKPDDILNSEIIIGNEQSVNDFHTKFYPMLEKIENNKKQIENLSKTRDQLLPKLMSGEVRVKF